MNQKERRTPRGRSYSREVDHALQIIAESLDYLCAERLQPNQVWMASHLAQHGGLRLSPGAVQQPGKTSVSSVRRSLQRLAQDQGRLPRWRPPPVNPVTRGIPASRIPWQEDEPGHFETDLVHHCGLSTSGQYVHTLQMIDVATGWSERVASWRPQSLRHGGWLSPHPASGHPDRTPVARDGGFVEHRSDPPNNSRAHERTGN